VTVAHGLPTRDVPVADDVLVTGLGVVSTLGCSVEELTRRFGRGERALESGGGAYVSSVPLDAVPPDKRGRIGRLDRLCRFFLAAAYLALQDAGLQIDAAEAERVGLSFGTGLGCLLSNEEYYRKVVEQGPAAASPRVFAYTVSSAAAGEVSIAAGITGPNVTAHMGLAAGLGAVGYGFDLIQMGKADVVLAGGADVIGEALVDGLRDMGLLKAFCNAAPYREARPGIFPSEAAVVAVLERGDRARRRGVPSWGRIDGYAAGFEPTLTRRQRAGTGIERAAERALCASRRSGDDVGLVVSSAHGTPIDEIERAALGLALGGDGSALLLAPKAALGECFGASGTLGLVLAAGSLRQRLRLADGVAFDVKGGVLDAAESARRLRQCDVVMVSALCYAGHVVNLILSRA